MFILMDMNVLIVGWTAAKKGHDAGLWHHDPSSYESVIYYRSTSFSMTVDLYQPYHMVLGDHPPITPVGLALPHELSGETLRIYELVSRHILASISPDAVFLSTKAKFTTQPSTLPSSSSSPSSSSNSMSSSSSLRETFTVRGRKELSPGFLHIYRTHSQFSRSSQLSSRHDGRVDFDADDNDVEEEVEDEQSIELPVLEKDQSYRITTVKSRQGVTSPPGITTTVHHHPTSLY